MIDPDRELRRMKIAVAGIFIGAALVVIGEVGKLLGL